MQKRLIGVTMAIVAGLGAVGFAVSASASTPRHKAVTARIIGTWPNDVSIGGTGGFVVYSNGRVVTIDGAPFYGSFNVASNNVVGFADNSTENGYWVVTSRGKIYGTSGVCGSDEKLQGPRISLKSGERVLGAVSPSDVEDDFALVTSLHRTFNYGCNFTF
jgi:hypothetical protein